MISINIKLLSAKLIFVTAIKPKLPYKTLVAFQGILILYTQPRTFFVDMSVYDFDGSYLK